MPYFVKSTFQGVAKARDPSTKDFVFQQTMWAVGSNSLAQSFGGLLFELTLTLRRYRIKDPQRSLDFYTRVLGFTLLEKLDFPDMKFSLYFLGQYPSEQIPEDRHDRVRLSALTAPPSECANGRRHLTLTAAIRQTAPATRRLSGSSAGRAAWNSPTTGEPVSCSAG